MRDEQVREVELLLEVPNRFSTWAWIETSSAETGSSHTISLGRRARACHPDPLTLPPENSCGKRL